MAARRLRSKAAFNQRVEHARSAPVYVLVDDDGIFCIFSSDFGRGQPIEQVKFFVLKNRFRARGMQPDTLLGRFSIRCQQPFLFETADGGRRGHKQQLSAIESLLLAILTQFSPGAMAQGYDSGQSPFHSLEHDPDSNASAMRCIEVKK